MSASRHTSGPWCGGLVDTQTYHGPRYRIEEQAGSASCVAYAYGRGNYHLIAAAPELLAVAKMFLRSLEFEYEHRTPLDENSGPSQIEDREWEEDELATVRAAIAKAEGES